MSIKSNALKITTRSGHEIFRFESVAAMDGYVDKTIRGPEFFTTNPSFTGREFNSWEQLQEALNKAWEEGIEIVEAFVTRLRKLEWPEIKEVKARKVYSTEGDEVDFDRLHAGVPEFFTKIEREKTGPATVTVVIDNTTAGYMDSEDILWRGAAALAFTALLEEKGYGVELWVTNGSRLYAYHPDRGVMTATCLKRAGDPLDMSTLTSVVSGWFYRTETFQLLHTICDHQQKVMTSAYGRVHSPTSEDLDMFTGDQKRVYVSGVFSFSGAADLIGDELKRISVED